MHISLQDVKPLAVTPTQRQWLDQKKVLKVGIYPHDSPPFGLITLSKTYEGLNVDYLGMIAAQLGLQLQLHEYESSQQRWQALRNGDIDVIPNSQQQYSDIFYSAPYASENPILAVNINDKEPLPLDLKNITVAIVDGYLSLKELKEKYPDARFQIYDNYQEAISSVAFGHTRVYFGNSYPIDQSFSNNMRLERFATSSGRQVHFALNLSASPLTGLFNSALLAVPLQKKYEIQQLWHANKANGIDLSVALNPAEKKWANEHPSVNVLLFGANNTAPVAFVDEKGSLRGVVADILSLVTLKTGLKFNVKIVESSDKIAKQIASGEADMVAAMVPSSERSKLFDFTYPYIRSSFVLVINKNTPKITRLADLRGKKLGLVKGSAMTEFVSKRYPEIDIVNFDNDGDMFDALANGKIDAIQTLLIISDYQTRIRNDNTFKIVSTVSSKATYVSFGVGRAHPELRDILNKVLMALPPNELDMMANRWRPNNMLVAQTSWVIYKRSLITLSLVTAIILLLAISRALLLRRNVINAALQVKMLENLINGMPFPITLRDLEGRLTFCNNYYLQLVDVPFTAVKGSLLTDQPRNITLEQAEFFQRKADEIIATKQPFIEDIDISIIDSHENEFNRFTANIWMLPWLNADGKVIGVVGGLWDVSERKELMQQLIEASDRAEASNKAKSTFLSTMSHEIRTPMNAIIGMLDMAIKRGQQGEQDLAALEVALESAEGLVGLIGDILDLSRVEGGDIEFRPLPINLAALINQLLVIFNGMAIDKNILLHRHLPTEEVVDVMGDPLRIKQVLSNVLGNAIKFTDQGSVTLKLSQQIDVENDRVHFVIDITDSGVGIDESQQAKLFQPYAQADNRRAGTGLGLFISRNLCQMMDGNLTLNSVLHQGTRVRAEFTLPRATLGQASSPVTDKVVKANESLNVLVADDNAANRMLLAKQLAWLGHHAHIAAGGEEAIILCQQQKFDVIITDCNMPKMNGYQFTQYIRQQELNDNVAPVWIVGFTANAMQEIIDRCLAAGMNDCLFKPCSINNLSQALTKRKIINTQSPTLTELTLHDAHLHQELLHRFVNALRDDCDEMASVADRQDWQSLGHLAHRVTGSVRIMRERALSDACEQLEQSCLASPIDVSFCQLNWQHLQKLIQRWLAEGAE